MLEHHLTTQVVYGPSQGPTEKGMMQILRKGFGGKPTGMQRAAALLRSVQGSSPIAEMWCDIRAPLLVFLALIWTWLDLKADT